ncbi:hypothetical protein SAMN05216480_12346 [Pustulibacterium marinum]|uniref:Uncharacterized protein n=1 Tax=Pustulibacterium marinum TaxID=1224947 RepID=A0A1I7IWN8_9FLAO|nr:hypothetical protein [Pustulibacterium marinum]SFU77350.1 hypothetical protein SAMN05216480_12346 [Pustulibacterium marinum]
MTEKEIRIKIGAIVKTKALEGEDLEVIAFNLHNLIDNCIKTVAKEGFAVGYNKFVTVEDQIDHVKLQIDKLSKMGKFSDTVKALLLPEYNARLQSLQQQLAQQ